MKIIKKLSEMIECEIDDSKKYAKCALKYYSENRTLAELFYTLSLEEMQHMNKLHKAVEGIIQDYRSNSGEPPANMLAVYEFLHERMIEKASEVKNLQTMFKEQ